MGTVITERSGGGIHDLVLSRRPGLTLEQPFYTDPRIFDLEVERIFRRHWLYVGHISQIQDRGDYFTCEVAGESLIILRDNDLQVQALYNVCRHRGSRVCKEPSGKVKSLVCPYHQWTYTLSGSLLAARHMPPGFEKRLFGLHHTQVRVLEGLIFVSLAEPPPEFAAIERDLAPHLRHQGLTRAKICHTRYYDVRANWKLIVENFRECYHCGPAHPQYCRVVGFAAAIDSPRVAAENKALTAEREAHWRAMDIETRPIDFPAGAGHHAVRFPLRKGCVSQSLDGQPVAPLMGSYPERDVGAVAVVILPAFWFEASSDYAVTLRFAPLEPNLTRAEMSWLVRADAGEGLDYFVEKVTAFWRATAEQDWELCEGNQAGVRSSRYQRGPYASIESGIETFVRWYLDQLSA